MWIAVRVDANDHDYSVSVRNRDRNNLGQPLEQTLKMANQTIDLSLWNAGHPPANWTVLVIDSEEDNAAV